MMNMSDEAPRHDRYFEDYIPGSVHEFGSVTVSESDIISFAKTYDSQFFHTDPEAAKKSIYGGLIASGIQTLAFMTQLLVKHFISQTSSLGSPGADELRWIKPVRPGDTLSLRVKILEARRSQSKPDRGIVHYFVEILNQKREIVTTVKVVNLYRCRKHEA
jgi:acyl dehydratase